MIQKKCRVLQVVAKKPVGGVGTFLRNSYINDSEFRFDIIESSNDLEGSFNEFFIEKGTHIFLFPEASFNRITEYWQKCDEFYKENHDVYDIVHIHSPSVAFPHLYYAKKYGIKVRVYHSHNTRYSDTFIKSIRNKFIVNLSLKYANTYFSCGQLAGERIFDKKRFEIIPNGVPLEDFKFNKNTRKKIRKDYEIANNTFLIGMIGSVNKIKNQKFILKVAEKLIDNHQITFFIIGDGDMRKGLEITARKKNLTNVKFLGRKNNISEFYSAMDCLVLPSLFEGFPLVSVEAQANGASIIASDSIDETMDISGQVFFLPIKGKNCVTNWKNKILDIQNNFMNDFKSREDSLMFVKDKGYSIKDSSNTLFYNYRKYIKQHSGEYKK